MSNKNEEITKMKEKKRGLKREGRKGVEKREGKKGRAWREERRIKNLPTG